MKNLVPQPARDLTGQPIKVDRRLPPHELNARRRRKRNLTQLPGIVCLSPVSSFPSAGELLSIQPGLAPGQKTQPSDQNQAGNALNDHVYNPATNPVNDHPA